MANWHYIEGFPKYKVSDTGIVWNKEKDVEVRTRNRNGYIGVTLFNDGYRKDENVHRLVAKAFLIGEPDQDQVNHKDGNKSNNHVDNLEWCTLSENRQHAYDNGLQHGRKGSKHHGAKFTEDEIREIKRKLANGYGVTKLARELGVSHATISLINTGKNWSHITI